MGNILVEVDVQSLKRSARGKIVGEIWVYSKTSIFPHRNWNDIVILVFTWWAQELHNYFDENKNSICLRFADGPYYINIKKDINNAAIFEFVDNFELPKVVSTGTFDFNKFCDNFLANAERISSFTYKCGWSGDDLNDFHRSIKMLSLLIRR